MPNIFIIIGDQNTRKSSTIRALTGVGREREIAVATLTQTISVFAKVSSLQEADILPQDFITSVQGHNYDNILVSLRIAEIVGRNGTRYPIGQTYIQEFVNVGWNIAEVVVLGNNILPYPLPAVAPALNSIANSTNIPVNQISTTIKNWWNWI